MPRSSRSHSTLVPAASITASTPQVMPVPSRQATIGNVPCAPWRTDSGRSSPTQTSSMPPVPNVILASPGRTQPWPTRDACWSPASAAIGGEPSSAVAVPSTPVVSTTRGSAARLMRSASSRLSSQSDPSGRSRPVTAALDRSVTCSVAAATAATRPTCRPCRRTGRGGVRGRPASSRWAAFVADSLGANRRPSPCQHEAVADRAQVLPAEAGTDRLAGRPVPHDGRGPLVGDPHRRHGPALGQGGAGHAPGRVGQGQRVELDEARGRGRRQRPAVVDRGHGGVGVDDRPPDARRADVDDEQRPGHGRLAGGGALRRLARGHPQESAPVRGPCRGATAARDRPAHQPPTGPHGEGRPSLPGLRMPRGSSACLAAASTSNAPPERRRHEPGPVEADAVVVAERPPGRQDRALAGVPQLAVVGVPALDGDLAGEREVEAAAGRVAVGLVGRRRDRALHAEQAASVAS